MLSFRPDKTSNTAYYLQIADRLRSLILKGYFNPGEALSERYIALKAGVSRNTVTRAFDILREYGFLDSRERFSTRIADGIDRMAQDDINWQRMLDRSSYKEAPPFFQQKIKENMEDNASGNITMVRFNAGEYHTRELFEDTVRSVTHEEFEKFFTVRSVQGLPELRAEVAKFLRRYGIHTSPANVTIYASLPDASACASTMLMSPNTVLFNQVQDGSDSFTQLSQINITRVKIRADGEGIIPAEFKRALDKYAGRNRILLLDPVNHVPTGVTMTRQRMADIAAICRRKKVPVLEIDLLRVTLNDKVSVDREILEKYESTFYSKLFAAPENQIFMEIMSAPIKDIEDMIANISLNYLKKS